jgi:polyphosphate kinase 2 (PPK2 family)
MKKHSRKHSAKRAAVEANDGRERHRETGKLKLSKKDYEPELFKLQIELVKMQEWVRTNRRTHCDHLRGT